MSKMPAQTMEVGSGDAARTIAYRLQPATRADGLGLIWLPGLKSDMVSTKATALAQWAPKHGFGLTRFDYSGHGESSGRFEDAVISDWVEEARAVLERLTTGPQIILGSSTGGHVALVLLRRLLREAPDEAARIKGLVLIAPAWDLTEALMWARATDEQKAHLERDGWYDLPSDYGDPYRITKRFIEDGRTELLSDAPFDPGIPIHVLQGALDDAVPLDHTRRMGEVVLGDRIRLTEIPDGGHSLSRDEDLALLFREVERVARI